MIKRSKRRNWTNTLIMILFIGIVGLIGLAGCNKVVPSNSNNPQSVTEENDTEGQQLLVLAYIKSIDTKQYTITIDEVELLSDLDEDRLEEIGMTKEDLSTGFLVYNQEENLKEINYQDTVIIELFEDTTNNKLSEVNLEKLVEQLEQLEQQEVLCDIILSGNEVVKISEKYLP